MATNLQNYLDELFLDQHIMWVNSQPELQEFPSNALKEGLLVWVKDEESFYRYSSVLNKWFKQSPPLTVDSLSFSGKEDQIYRINKKQYDGVKILPYENNTQSGSMRYSVWFNTSLTAKEIKSILNSVLLGPAYSGGFTLNDTVLSIGVYPIFLIYHTVTVEGEPVNDFGDSLVILSLPLESQPRLIVNLAMIKYLVDALNIDTTQLGNLASLLNTTSSPKYYFSTDDINESGLVFDEGWNMSVITSECIVIGDSYGKFFEEYYFDSTVSSYSGLNNDSIKKIISRVPFTNGYLQDQKSEVGISVMEV